MAITITSGPSPTPSPTQPARPQPGSSLGALGSQVSVGQLSVGPVLAVPPVMALSELVQTATQLSPGAQLLNELLQGAAPVNSPGAEATRPGPQGSSLLPKPTQSLANMSPQALSSLSSQLSQALQTSIGQSGLFYEAHLQQWVDGKRPQAELLKEPQNQQGLTAAQQLLPHQLNSLEQQRLQWQGAVWPDLPVQMTIQADPDQPGSEAQPADPADRVWRSTLQVSLPSLGAVQVQLSLQSGRLRLGLWAEQPEARQQLLSASNLLQEGLGSAGLALEQLRMSPTPLEGQLADPHEKSA